MSTQRAVIAAGAGSVEVADVPFEGLRVPALPGVSRAGEKLEHGATLRVLASSICGSDLHVTASTNVAVGSIQGHEATGVVTETGRDVERIRVGDVCSIPFNVACGRCSNCLVGFTSHCCRTGTGRPGATYGMGVPLGGWAGLQSEQVLVPYADFNLYAFDDRDQARERLDDLCLLADMLPTAFHASEQAGVGPGSTVFVAGGGPVGLASAAICQLRGASAVVVGEPRPERRRLAEAAGFLAVDPDSATIRERLFELIGHDQVDVGLDCVGGDRAGAALDTVITVTRPGGAISVAGVYPAKLPDDDHPLSEIWLGGVWSKALRLSAGSTPARRYQEVLSKSILDGGLVPSRYVQLTSGSLEEAPECYRRFRGGEAAKFVLKPTDA